MNSKLERGEIVAILGGLLLAGSIFLSWYRLGNQFAVLSGHGPNASGESLSAWGALSLGRFVLLLAALAPFVLGYIILRGHALSWPRGELTAVIAIVAITVTLVRGVIDKPGDPTGQIQLQPGWFVALLAGVVILIGSVIHRQQFDTVRKPPGVL